MRLFFFKNIRGALQGRTDKGRRQDQNNESASVEASTRQRTS